MKTLIRYAAALTCTAIALLTATGAQANNIQVTNPTVTHSEQFGTATIHFDLSWENSWREIATGRWDAAWVFVKYKMVDGWHHAHLLGEAVATDFNLGLLVPDNPYDSLSNPVMGVFIFRSQDGHGNMSLTDVQLTWACASFNDISQVQVFAIEMAHVPEGAFAAGSGGTEESAFVLTTINTADATMAPSGTGSLGGEAGGYPTGQAAPLNSSWPNGFKAFYCMKYEISQQGFVDFYNTLTNDQQLAYSNAASNHFSGPDSPPGSPLLTLSTPHNAITLQTTGINGAGGATYVCDNFQDSPAWLSSELLNGYLVWCGLRPMTELEFEKACRGPVAPVADEYPWGNTSINGVPYTLFDPGAANEGIATNYSTTSGNANVAENNGVDAGPYRVGIFAANAASDSRASAGASYYGIMELAGNLAERTISIAEAGFDGQHGDGNSSGAGVGWPTTETTDAGSPIIFRGGGFDSVAALARVSARPVPVSNSISCGGRGVRTAP